MTFITLNRPDIIKTTYAKEKKCVELYAKQNPVTINPEKIISMIEYFDSDGKFLYTMINMEDSLHYDVSCNIKGIVELIDYSYSTGSYVDINEMEE